jgi:hypothetical protein
MALLASTHPTLLDVAKRLDPDGKVATVVEMLAQQNEVLDDAVWLESNETTSHVTTVRTGLPAPTWRKLYGFVQPTKSTTVQVRDNTGMLEAYAEVDKALADLNGNTAAFRLSEDAAHIEGMNQEQADTLFFGNEGTEPEAFTGLAPRFNDLSAANGQNIIDAAGDSDRVSIWLVVWGPNTVHMLYPKGSKAGLQINDKGVVTVESLGNSVASAGRMEAYRTHYRWDSGMSVRDWRYVVRIANIDQAALTKDPATAGADLIDLMTQALEVVQDLTMGRPAFYMNRTLRSILRRQMVTAVKGSTLQMEEVAGKKVMTFDGIPVRRVDRLTSGESAVS